MEVTQYSISSSSTLFLPVSSNLIKIIPKGKPMKFKGSPFNQKLHTPQPKPKTLFRLWLGHCFNFFLSGVILSSNFNFFLSAADALDSPNAESNRYPCEDAGGYYSGVDGLRGDALMKELRSIIYPHKSLPYKKVWEALKILDAADIDNPEASSEVIEIYSQRAVLKALAGKPEGWNREHLWPRSYGLTDGPSLTDLHNIRPADVNVNSSRGNKYYGECDVLSTHCLRPANQEAAPDTETDKQRWAPPIQVRGDVARSVLYMALCYGFLQPGGNSYLQLSNSPSMERKEMGLLSALLKWNEIDPPSRAEKLRNDRICRFYQHNRNPFVDHPEYAIIIWNDAFPSSPASYNPSLKAWINEFHYNNRGKDKNEFVEIIARSSTDASTLKLILYNGANGREYRSLALADKNIFTVRDVGSSGFLIYTAFIPLQNGPADGMSLVSREEVLQFLSYEGRFKAVDGPAQGMESVDIMKREDEDSSGNDSIGLGGQCIGEFEWKKFVGEASPGKVNMGQEIHY